MPLVLRNVKGTPLTYDELDRNFITLESLVISLRESNLLGDPDAVAYTIGAGLVYEPENDNLLKHGPTSNQGTVVNSGNDVIQSLTLDSFGHITNISTKSLDSSFVKFSGNQAINGDTTFIGNVFASSFETPNLNVTSNLAIDGFVRANSYQASGTAIPTISSSSSIFLDALDAVVIQDAPLRLANFSTNELTGQFGTAGDIVYDFDQQSPVYYNGEEWITIGTDSLAAGVGYTGSQGPIGFHGSTGFTGSAGAVGFTGSEGVIGPQGSQGSIGFSGSQGEPGILGSQGFTGSKGEPGAPGAFAALGYTGSQGPAGFTGSKGERGNDGSKGFDGSLGYHGSKGEQGFTGSKGDKGFAGSKGETGFVGSRGEKGISGTGGFDGSQGEQGFTGSKGEIGFTGSKGNTGNVGSKGDIGFTGSQGTKGDKGNTGSKGDKGNTGSKGDKGFDGSKGDKGNTGSKGDKGNTGSKGDKGNTGSKGDKGNTGSKGDKGYTGSKGDRGNTGSKGDKGNTGSRGIKGNTGSRGTSGARGTRGYSGSPGRNAVDLKSGRESIWVKSLRVGIGAQYASDGEITAEKEITAFYSDERLKKNVELIDNALTKTLSLRGVTYNEIDSIEEITMLPREDRKFVGVIAQDIQKVLPEAVAIAPFDMSADGSKSGEEYLTVRYEKLTALLIEAIKDLNEKVEDLEAKLQE